MRWDYALSDRSRLKTVAAISHIDQPGDGGSDLTPEDLQRAAVPHLFADRVPAGDGGAALHRAPGAGRDVLLRRHALHPIQRARSAPVVAAELRSPGLGEPAPLGRRCSPATAGWWRRSGPTSAPAWTSSTPRAAASRREIAPQRAGQVFTGYTSGEVQYDYDVTFWQASPYAQADVSLPGRVQLSAGARYDHIGYDYDNRLTDLATGSHRRPASTGVTFDRISPKLGRHLGARAQRQPVRLLPRGVPRAVGEPALPPGLGGEHGGPQAGPGAELGGRIPHRARRQS